MAYLKETPRRHMQIICLESNIGVDNPVRFIDAFTERLELSKTQDKFINHQEPLI